MHHRLTVTCARQLAFQFAKANHNKYPIKWDEKSISGYDWYRGFRHRHPELSLRTPESTSLSQRSSFNRTNATMFFNNLESALKRVKFQSHQIWNIDKTGLTTVHKPANVLAVKGVKQVGNITSAERGYIMLEGDSSRRFSSFQGYILRATCYVALFQEVLELLIPVDHFIKHSGCTMENKVLLPMNNHESHISVESLRKAKENGIKPATPPQSSSSEEEEQSELGGSSEDISDVESYERQMLQVKALEDVKTLKVGDFVLVKFYTKTLTMHYVGLVISKEDDEYKL
ncbi:unnamed protein product [Acanthoscelides obtectus]|uniref:Uncharacterized protein n=1 Tax=Acanthoscelides obtectus TaxID=200917 RepID=A0A9P0NXJ1_ACAOB|nr:unnamed protein product [Acanthoscelides obtectus]CAK1638127.1 hypothetical protein AOBTE_LOCUS10402 [Acanthoscelides obtectus]